jgi:HAD superfamily hydrolase (TIGR01509 family)
LDSGSYILNTIGRVDLSPAWVVDQLLTAVVDHVESNPIVWRPGAIELLKSFSEAGVPCALVSASYRVLLDAALRRLPENTFRVTVAGDEVSRGKPHPEPYEKACTDLGVLARHCVVFEDSETGCRAGNAAGALVVAIPNRVEIPKAPRRLHVRSLAELDAATVAQMLEQFNGD